MFQGSSNHGAPDQHSNVTTDMPFRQSVSGPGGMAAAQNAPSLHLPPENTMFSMSLDHGATQRHGNPSLDASFDSMPSPLTSEESSLFRNDFNFSKTLNKPLLVSLYAHGHYDFPSQAAGIPSSSGLGLMQLLAEEIKKINIKLSELQIANERLTLCVEDGEVAINSL
ncbi:hypothetical protein J3A83DRAFT_4185838 [Scleroderma citrinum]